MGKEGKKVNYSAGQRALLKRRGLRIRELEDQLELYESRYAAMAERLGDKEEEKQAILDELEGIKQIYHELLKDGFDNVFGVKLGDIRRGLVCIRAAGQAGHFPYRQAVEEFIGTIDDYVHLSEKDREVTERLVRILRKKEEKRNAEKKRRWPWSSKK